MPLPDIPRRDLLQGATALTLGAWAGAARPAGDGPGPEHPSRRTGLQGQTDEVNAAAHAGRDQPGRWDATPAARDEAEEDLVVVGAGLSGLAGAWLYRQHAGRPVRILLLDALDDVGGHARRNEFVSRSGRRLVGYGGSQALDSPGLFSPAVHQLLRDAGIHLARFPAGLADTGWSERHGVTRHGWFFGADAWGGTDRLVIPEAGEPDARWLGRTPLSAATQAQWARLRATSAPHNPLPGLRTVAARRSLLARLSYDEFLRRHWQAGPELLRVLRAETQAYFGVGTDATTALDAWAGGLPGFAGLDLGDGPDRRQSPSGRQLMLGQDPYLYHFPDGNAGVARALIRGLIPGSLPGQDMDSLADAVLDMAALDRPDAPVRLRLRATAVGLRHLGPPERAEQVAVRYLDGQGRLREVRARQVLLACWHRVIARLTDELPAAQVRALDDQVKVPLLYTNVLLSNWRAFARAGLHGFTPVDGFWGEVSLDFAVRMGRIAPPEHPDEPVLLHLAKVVVPGNGAPARTQAQQGRAQLLGWSFEHLEQQVRRTLQGALGPHGFDERRDIEAITVNRWAHGYAYEYMRPWDAYWPAGPLPCETARRGWGRVAIANADAGAYAYAHSAIDQATRAVQELLPAARLPRAHVQPGPDWHPSGRG